MKVKFIQVQEELQICKIAQLADKIWREHYGAILDKKQINYMLDKFQSIDAIKDQISKQNYQYYLLNIDGVDVGFTGIKEEPDEERLFLSKIYIDKDYRGYGYGSDTFEFLEDICKQKSFNKIWLTVNRYNENSIKAYEKKGFVIAYSQVTDIGQGYVMDDYIMEKTI